MQVIRLRTGVRTPVSRDVCHPDYAPRYAQRAIADYREGLASRVFRRRTPRPGQRTHEHVSTGFTPSLLAGKHFTDDTGEIYAAQNVLSRLIIANNGV